LSETWTPLALVRWTTSYFTEHGVPSPRLDAEVLLCHVLGMRRIDLYLQFDRPVEADERARYRDLVRLRAAKRVPVAYLTGIREFWSRSFEVSPAVLVRVALELTAERVLEVGIGSGAIAATLALERPDLALVATDCSTAALEVARANLARLGVADRVSLLEVESSSGAPAPEGRFDLIVSNPPYIATADLASLAPELQHEPQVALDGGLDGLDVIRRILQDGPGLLATDGAILLEVGSGQAPFVASLMGVAGARQVELLRDFAGIERVVLGRFGSGSPAVGSLGDRSSGDGSDGLQRT
jgi:release factor glutamine methyltransferase